MKALYRADIDGMRALSVLAVIIFHIDNSILPGGFLGVDIFFVISGYLITGIIYSGINDNSFSYKNFYDKRIKRILPAFFFMVTCTLIVGYFILLPYEYYKVSISAMSTLVFSSNMQFALRTGDYFATDASEWPLLHTWSLAVEEQYYFIFPIALILCVKLFKSTSKNVIVGLAILCFLSFSFATILSTMSDFEKVSYYILPARIGELIVGSILAIHLYKTKQKLIDNNFISSVSLLIIILSFVFIDSSMIFPGFLALPACVSAALLIYSHNTFVNKILSHKYLIKVGLMSYSLYLIHWPVLAFLRYIFNIGLNDSLSIKVILLAVVLIIFISSISYYLIEIPCRKKDFSFRKTVIVYFFIPSIIIGSFSTFIILEKGYVNRLSTDSFDASRAFSHINKITCPSLVNLGCMGGDTNSDKLIVLYGNSHAEHYFSLLDAISRDLNYQLTLIASGGCGILSSSSKCKAVNTFFNSNYKKSKNPFLS